MFKNRFGIHIYIHLLHKIKVDPENMDIGLHILFVNKQVFSLFIDFSTNLKTDQLLEHNMFLLIEL